MASFSPGGCLTRTFPRLSTTTWPLVLALGIVYLVWGSTYLAIRVAVEGLPPFLMAGMRYAIASSVMILAGLVTRQARPTGREVLSSSIVGLFLLLGGNGLVVWAEQFVASSLAALLVASVPLWILILEAFWPGGTRPTRLGVLGVLLGFAGVVALMWPQLAGGEHHALWAQGVVLVGTFLWAVGTLLGRRFPMPRSGIYNSAFQMLAASAAFLAISFGFGEPYHVAWSSVPPQAWGALAYLVVAGSCIAFSAFAWLVQNAKPDLVSTYAYVNPVVAVGLGALILSEPIDAWVLGGAALIVASVALVVRGGRSARA